MNSRATQPSLFSSQGRTRGTSAINLQCQTPSAIHPYQLERNSFAAGRDGTSLEDPGIALDHRGRSVDISYVNYTSSIVKGTGRLLMPPNNQNFNVLLSGSLFMYKASDMIFQSVGEPCKPV